MKKLYLSILWHQHQPYYKDDSDGLYHLPWVFLHAIKDYYEMARHVEKANNVRVIFNFVPSLLEQLEDYTNNDVKDALLIRLRKHAAELSGDERTQTVDSCFAANVENMIRPNLRFSSYLNKYESSDKKAYLFSDDEINDLETLYILSWCGEYLRREDDTIKCLFEKKDTYSHEDKLQLLGRLTFWVSQVKAIHKRLKDENKAEISCTPYYHPILPIISDFNSAKESCPEIHMPDYTVDLSNDADWHIKEGLKKFEQFFGFRAKGMWPAEGSVSQKTIPLYAKHGVEWVATDEEVLGNSLKLNIKDKSNRRLLYMKRFQFHYDRKINIFFRDKALSDLIGFTYASFKADDAVKNFISHLKNIYDSVNFSPHVSVILDGENAWEYYKNNAFEFFDKLYYALGSEDWLETATFEEVIRNNDIPEETVAHIPAGSWIMGNFKIWIGHAEKNRAWELLSKAASVIDKNINNVNSETKEKIYKELHIAEGSDWFWWFGDDHFSTQSHIFDRLFRSHLINIYKLLDMPIPPELFIVIKKTTKTGLIRSPSAMISPKIGKGTADFYKWLGSGEYDLTADASAMHAGSNELKSIKYAFDENKLYLTVSSDILSETQKKTLEIELLSGSQKEIYTADLSKDEYHSKRFSYVALKSFEAAIDIKGLTNKLYLVLRLKKDDKIIEKAPLYSAVEIDITKNFDDEWII